MSKPFVFDICPIGLAHLLFSVTVDEQGNCKHVAISGLVAKMLARCALYAGFERAPTLIRSIVLTLQRPRWGAVLTVIVTIAVMWGAAAPGTVSIWREIPLSLDAINSRAVALDKAERQLV